MIRTKDLPPKRRKGRLSRLTCYDVLELPALRSVWLLSIVPAFLFSCTVQPPGLLETKSSQIYITKAEKTTPDALDLFFFYPEEPFSLDAYQRFSPFPAGTVTGVSTCGERRIAAVGNMAGDPYAWSDILSFRNLADRTVFLSAEDPGQPVLTGTGTVSAGSGEWVELELAPLLVRIALRSIRCDFSAHPYAGEKLESVRIYLTHVKGSTSLFGTGSGSVWLNDGKLSETDLSSFQHPEILLQELPKPVGETAVLPRITLCAYPNETVEEDLANRRTRLVIEGRLLGETYYYPVEIHPLDRGTNHILDVLITRAGTTDPEILADSGMITVLGSVAPWNEMDPRTETY